MKLIERGGMWQVHFADKDGTRRRESTKIRVNAGAPDRGEGEAMIAALDIVRERLLDGTPAALRDTRKQSFTLGYALLKTWELHWKLLKAKKSNKYQVDRLVKEIGYWTLAGTTFTRLEEYCAELRDAGNKPSTLNQKMSAVRTALEHARKRGEIEVVPDIPNFEDNNLKERYLELDEERIALAWLAGNAAPADVEACYMAHLVPVLLDTGLRLTEALTLTPTQRRPANPPAMPWGAVWLPHGSTKTNRGRVVPLTERAAAGIDAMLASPMQKQLIAWHRTDEDRPARWAGNRFRTLTDKTKIAGVTLHTLRHTCASRLVQAGVDLYRVKEWLGHRSITTTERYAHLAPASLSTALFALEGARVGGDTTPRAEATVDEKKPQKVLSGTFERGDCLGFKGLPPK